MLFTFLETQLMCVSHESKFLVADFIKGLAEVKQNEVSKSVSLLFLRNVFEKIINQHEELGFTSSSL